jgi:prefoldin subunit 5
MAPTPENSSLIAGKRTSPDLSTSEIIALSNEVKDAVSGRKYLERTAIAISGKPYTTEELSGILMHITQLKSVPLSAQTAIRAVAFILDEHASIETANTIAKHILAAISPHIETIQATSETLTTTSIALTKANTGADLTTIKATASRIEDAADGIFSSIKDVKNAIELLSPSLDSTQHQLNSIATKLTPAPTQSLPPPPGGKPTYSTITASNLLPSTDCAIARASICARQILLLPKPNEPIFPPRV